MSVITELGRETLYLFVKMAPYLLLGLTVAGLLSVVMRKSFVARQVGSPGIGAVVKASLLGVPLPLCSCGVVPTAAYLTRAGASRPAVMSFLISTPQTGVDSIIATYGMLGPVFAVFRPLAALLTGIAGGVVSIFTGGGLGETSAGGAAPSGAPEGVRGKARAFVTYAYGEAIDDIAVQFLVGLVIGGLVAILIPADFFIGRTFGSGLPAMLLMVLVGIPMYVCSTSSIPIAVALIAKGLSPGAAYVFLVAGPATNAATLAVLSRVLGRRQTVMYVATLVLGSLVFGPVMELVTQWVGWTPPGTVAGGHAESLGLIDYLLSGTLAFLLTVSLVRRWWPWRRSTAMTTEVHSADAPFEVMSVEGMTCQHCAANVEDAVRRVPGVDHVTVDLHTREVRLQGITDSSAYDEVAEAVRAAGYRPITQA